MKRELELCNKIADMAYQIRLQTTSTETVMDLMTIRGQAIQIEALTAELRRSIREGAKP